MHSDCGCIFESNKFIYILNHLNVYNNKLKIKKKVEHFPSNYLEAAPS